MSILTTGQRMNGGIEETHDHLLLRGIPADPDLPSSSQSPKKSRIDGIDEKLLPARQEESGNEDIQDLQKDAQVSWRTKVPALTCILFFTLGSTYCQSTLAPLKSTIKSEISDVNNSRYGAISSSDHLINGVLLIFSGIAIHHYGPILGSLVSSTFVVLGAVVRAVGGQKGSFPIILGGQILFGIGSKTLETVQSKLYSHWQAFGRLFSLMGNATAIPITDSTGQWYWAFWVVAILSAFALLLIIIYTIIEKSPPPATQLVTGHELAARAKAGRQAFDHDVSFAVGSQVSSLRQHWYLLSYSILSLPASFCLLAVTQIMQAGVAHAYTGNLSEIIPIVMTPVFGICFDLFGRRMWLVSATASSLDSRLCSTGLYQRTPIGTLSIIFDMRLNVILGSLALSSNAIPFMATIPLLVSSQESIGTAYGVSRSMNSAGITIVDVSVGAIQDRTPKGANQYNGVSFFLIALKAVDVFYGLIYDILDMRFFGSVLRLNEKTG